MNYPSLTIKAITEFIFIGQETDELCPSNLVIVLGNHIIDIMMGEVAALYEQGKIAKEAVFSARSNLPVREMICLSFCPRQNISTWQPILILQSCF